jgi:glycerol kinase
VDADTTALGAAALAGLALEMWPDLSALTALARIGGHYEPTISRDEVESRKLVWRTALRRARDGD